MNRSQIARTRTRARQAYDVLMSETGRVTRPDGPGVFDSDTGIVAAPEGATVYEGRCYRRPTTTTSGSGVESRVDTEFTERRSELVVPHDAGPFRIGDVFQVVCPSDRNLRRNDMQARRWRVTSVRSDTNLLKQVLDIEEVTGG